MAKNADEQADDDSKKVTPEEELRNAKYGDDEVESSDDSEADETSEDEGTDDDAEDTDGEEDGQTDDDAEDDDSEEDAKTDSDDDDSEFVKEFPNIKGDTLVDYARNMEKTLQSSNTEGKRLSDENKELKAENDRLKTQKPASKSEGDSEEDSAPTDPRLLYAEKMINKDAQKAFDEFKKTYSQANDPTEYSKFQDEVTNLTKYYLSQGEIMTADELYPKAAAILGWEPTSEKISSNDRLKVAIKGKASTSKTTSGKASPKKSKISEAVIAANRLMYPNKTDAQIIKELEPYAK